MWYDSSVQLVLEDVIVCFISLVQLELKDMVVCFVLLVQLMQTRLCVLYFFFCYNCKVRFDSFSPRWLWWVRRKGSLFCLQSFGLKYRLLIRLMKVGKTSPNHNAFGLNKVCTRKAYGSRQYDLNCKTLMSRYSGAKLWQGRDMLFGLIMW